MSEKSFTCNKCNKNYKSYKSLWNHNKKFHSDIYKNYTENIQYPSETYTKSIQKIYKNENQESKKDPDNICIYCNKQLSCYYSLYRHLKICKIKQEDNDIKKVIKKLTDQNTELSNELLNIKKQFSNNIQIKNNNINSNNTINNINIIELDKERDYPDVSIISY